MTTEPMSPEQMLAPIADPRAAADLDAGFILATVEVRGGPERVFKADAVSAEVLKRCTGEATFAAIIDDLAAAFSAPRERILADVTTMLRGLADKRLLEL